MPQGKFSLKSSGHPQSGLLVSYGRLFFTKFFCFCIELERKHERIQLHTFARDAWTHCLVHNAFSTILLSSYLMCCDAIRITSPKLLVSLFLLLTANTWSIADDCFVMYISTLSSRKIIRESVIGACLWQNQVILRMFWKVPNDKNLPIYV